MYTYTYMYIHNSERLMGINMSQRRNKERLLHGIVLVIVAQIHDLTDSRMHTLCRGIVSYIDYIIINLLIPNVPWSKLYHFSSLDNINFGL